MRLITIPKCSYAQYEQIRDAIYSVIPFALFNQQYVKSTQTAYFNFWDVSYIPPELQHYIMQPPLSRENVDLLHEKLTGLAALDYTKN